MTPDPCDLRDLDPRTRDLTLAALKGWTCRWPYQPPQAGRAPGRAYETTDRYGHVVGTDRYAEPERSPRDPLALPRRWTGRV